MRILGALLSLILLIPSAAAESASKPMPVVGNTLTVAFYEEAPYQFVGKDGSAVGLLVDLFDAVAKQAGYTVDYALYASLAECVEASEDGEVDLILGVQGVTKYNLSETVELYESSLVIAQDTEHLENTDASNRFTVAGYNYYATNPAVIYSLKADRFIITDRSTALVTRLAGGELDMVILDQAVLQYWLTEKYPGYEATITNKNLDSIKYTVGSVEGDSTLFRKLNTAILDLRISGNYKQIIGRWIKEEPETNWRAILIWSGIAAGAVLIIFFIYFIISRRIRKVLEKELMERTRDISEANAQLTDRVRQLQFEGELRKKLIRNAHSAMVMIDSDYRVLLLNPSARKMSGYQISCEGATLEDLPCFREAAAPIKDKLFSDGFSVENQLVSLQINDATLNEFRLNIHQIVESDVVTAALITLENVTQEQRLLRASYEKDKHAALNHMIAGIAHEIKNPLMSIRTYAMLIKQKAGDADFRASFSEFVPREADRINDLVESLVSYARPAKGTRMYVNLCSLVQECAYLSGIAKRKAAIDVVVRAEGEVMVYVKPDQIKQAIINMMLNGIEAMEIKQAEGAVKDEPLRLLVTVEAEQMQARLTIEDNGIGMNDATRQLCTNLFYTTKEQGTGLGLALSAQYISENDGWMDIASEEGKFTRFTVWFPLSKGGEGA